jgi:hypothetical protein
VGALLAGARADDLVVRRVVEHRDQLGDALVRIGQVGVGPDHDLAAGLVGADAPGRARPAVAPEGHQPHVREARQGLLEHGQRRVGGGVVDGEQLVAVAAGVHRGGDALDLVQHVVLLVVAGQHDRDLQGATHLGAAGVGWGGDGVVAARRGQVHGVAEPTECDAPRRPAAPGDVTRRTIRMHDPRHRRGVGPPAGQGSHPIGAERVGGYR